MMNDIYIYIYNHIFTGYFLHQPPETSLLFAYHKPTSELGGMWPPTLQSWAPDLLDHQLSPKNSKLRPILLLGEKIFLLGSIKLFKQTS